MDRENAKVSAESQKNGAPADRDEGSTSAAAREMRRREREQKTKNKEMTEEEMVALALRLSEQEANITAQKRQEEEEAVRKALQDSMFVESQSVLDGAPPGVSSRRKLVYSNGESQAHTEHSTADSGEGKGQRAAGLVYRTRKRRRVEDSPLMEMPDLSQTQPTACISAESASLSSPQSCDSTQMEACDAPRSPVFPASSPQVQIRVSRLGKDLLDSCAASGFVLCSQESGISTQSSHSQQPARSPTFPKSPAPRSKNHASKAADSQMFDLGEGTQLEPSQGPRTTSTVFGQTDRKSALQANTADAIALTFSSQESSKSFCLEKDVSLSKSLVFSKTQGGSERDEGSERQSPVFGTNGRTVTTFEDELDEQEEPIDEEEQGLSQKEPSIDMTLHWSEEEEDNTTPVVSPSPVFPEERRVRQPENENESAPSHTQCSASAPHSGSAVSEAPCSTGDSVPLSTVHYYWGVPFCPRGLDPDQYTKVIMAQMEVYEKSLKQAQRGLLNKAKWGEPILPEPGKCPSPEANSHQNILSTRRSRRLRGRVMELDSEEEVEEVTADTQGSQQCLWEEEEGDKERNKEIRQDRETEASEEAEDGLQKEPTEEAVVQDHREDEAQGESDCEVCPETQLSDDSTQELALTFQPLVRSPEIEMVQVDSPDVPDIQMPPAAEPEEPLVQGPESQKDPMKSTELVLFKPGDMDLGGPHSETQSRESPQQSQSADLDQNHDQNLGQTLESGELSGLDVVPRLESSVQCPICQHAFPSDQIEMHAAFCDGAPAVGDRASPKLRRNRTRRGETEEANHTDSQPRLALAQEKCYICLKAVPLRDYGLHTDRCLQRPVLRTATTGGLLSALDQSEHRDSEAGPSGSTAQPQEVIDLVDDDEEDSVSLIQISNSPIRSFTSISDAQDCLIDFRRQHHGKRPRIKPETKKRSKHR